MTQFLPPNLLALFKPRDPIPYLPPVDKLPYEKKTAGYTGIADFLNQFEDPSETPPPLRIETREERQERKRREKAEQMAYKLEQDIALWDPTKNPNATGDPYKTLFVARVNYDTSEAKLRREFELYGSIRRIAIIYDIYAKNSPKARGYAFIEYERERDMHSAYKHADGRKIDGRRVLVDVERGRTVKGWLPRRLGGGLGGTRRGGPEVNVKHSGREEPRPEDRYMNRDRDRADRPDHRSSRSRSRERRRRSRSRSRDRRRRDRHSKRERSRDRERPREHEAGAVPEKTEIAPDAAPEVPPDGDRRRRRSRSRDRDRRRSRRSRSRDRKKRDYDKDRESRRERERPRDQEELSMSSIKEEPTENRQDNYENNGGFDNDYKNDYNNYNDNSMQNTSEYEGY